MKPIKTVFLVTLVILVGLSLAITAAVAQGRKGAFGPRTGMMDGSRFWGGLDLTTEQKAQLEDSMRANRQQCVEVRNSNLTPEQKQARISELQAACRADLDNILTPAQRERAQQFWGQRNVNGRGKSGFPGMGTRGGYGLEQLGLNQVQKDKIAAIRQDTQNQVLSVRLDAKLTENQKADKIEAIRTSGHNEVLQLLTPDQQKSLEQWRASSPMFGKKGSMGKPGGMRGGGMGRGKMRYRGPYGRLP